MGTDVSCGQEDPSQFPEATCHSLHATLSTHGSVFFNATERISLSSSYITGQSEVAVSETMDWEDGAA